MAELETGFGECARLRAGATAFLFRAEEPGEDSAAYSNDCFDHAGQLGHIGFEPRAALGSAQEQEGPIAKGAMVAPTSEFLSTETRRSPS